jgi:hypothetical protein
MKRGGGRETWLACRCVAQIQDCWEWFVKLGWVGWSLVGLCGIGGGDGEQNCYL